MDQGFRSRDLALLVFVGYDFRLFESVGLFFGAVIEFFMFKSYKLRRRDRSTRRSPRYELHLSPARGEMSG